MALTAEKREEIRFARSERVRATTPPPGKKVGNKNFDWEEEVDAAIAAYQEAINATRVSEIFERVPPPRST